MIYTVGHGNRSTDEFLDLLKGSAIEWVVDIRAYPASRRHPQFAREALDRSLADAGIAYVWEGNALGGRRRPTPNSPNTALTNPGFRAYADHMVTEAFQAGLERLLERGRSARTAILCAERLPWQCHRLLVSDFLVAAGEEVVHLVNPGSKRAHALSAAARLQDRSLVYDVGKQGELKLRSPRAGR
jgi:uncharacterized protein (DUF488 family)